MVITFSNIKGSGGGGGATGGTVSGITLWSGEYTQEYIDSAVTGAVATAVTEAVATAVTEAMTAYTPTSGFSTINGSAITSGDNLVIEGTPYSGGTGIGVENHIISVTGDYETVVELTQAEYDALTAYSENTTYIITDAPAINMSAYTPTSGFSTINGSAITTGDAIVIETGGNYSAGTNIDITNDVISVTGITVPTKLSELQNDEGFVNSGEVETQITSKDYPTKNWVQGHVTLAISGKLDTDVFTAYTANTKTELDNKQDASAMTAYYTSAQTDTAIANAVSGKVDTSTFEQAALYIEQEFINVGTALDGKVDTSAMTEYYTSAETETAIQNATSGLATEQYVDDAIAAIDIPTVPTNVSEFVNDAGYITSEDLIESGYTTQDYVDNALAETNDHVDNMEEMTATALLELKNTKADATALTEYAKAEHVAELEQVTSAALNDLNSNKADASALTAYATTEEVQDVEDHIDNMEEMTAIALMDLKNTKADATALTEYAKSEHLGEVEQVTSVALNNLETNKVGSTDVHHMSVVTQAQYDAMAQGGTLDSSTFYIIL